MSRAGRIVLPNYPHHVVQRGHNREVVFAKEMDYQHYLETLRQFNGECGVEVLAYCLMTNHVHLILRPGEETAGLGRLMKHLAGGQTRYTNRLRGRSGTLWESRYRSSPIETDRYLLACCRYVECNPVRARMVEAPETYRWSSYRQRVGLDRDGWLDGNPGFEALGVSFAERRERYVEFLNGYAAAGEEALIREAVRRGQLTGGSRFVEEVAAVIGRRVEGRGPGRPKKE